MLSLKYFDCLLEFVNSKSQKTDKFLSWIHLCYIHNYMWKKLLCQQGTFHSLEICYNLLHHVTGLRLHMLLEKIYITS